MLDDDELGTDRVHWIPHVEILPVAFRMLHVKIFVIIALLCFIFQCEYLSFCVPFSVIRNYSDVLIICEDLHRG